MANNHAFSILDLVALVDEDARKILNRLVLIRDPNADKAISESN